MHIVELLSGKKYVSGNELGKIFGISRAAVHKRIKTLRKNGYVIVSSQQGYKIEQREDVFNGYEVLKLIKGRLSVCRDIIHTKNAESTQIKIKELAEQNFPEGTVFCADRQSRAYGRMGRKWSAAEGGLWFSFILRPSLPPDEAPKLALIISIALSRILEKKFNIKTSVKWPNDILFKGKKLSGIIIEMSAEQDRINWAAVGIGINLNNVLPASMRGDIVSLGEITGKNISRAFVLAEFMTEFDGIYKRFIKRGFEHFAREYNKKVAFIDEVIKIDRGYDIIKGINKGINSSGKLMIRTKNGTEEIISGTLRRMK